MTEASLVLLVIAVGLAAGWYLSATSDSIRSQMRRMLTWRALPYPIRAIGPASRLFAPSFALLAVATLVPRGLAQILVVAALDLFATALLVTFVAPLSAFPDWLRAEIRSGLTRRPEPDIWDAAIVWLMVGMAATGTILFVAAVATGEWPLAFVAPG